MKQIPYYLSAVEIYLTNEEKTARLARLLNVHAAFYVSGKSEGGIYVKLSSGDYKRAFPQGELSVLRHCGLLPFLRSHLDRSALVLGAIACLLTLYISSFFVWDIVTLGDEDIPSEYILSALADSGLRCGAYIPSLDISSIEANMLIKCTELSYISLNLDGSAVIAEYGRRVSIEDDTAEEEVSNIVADEDGRIINRITQCGTPICKAGDVVRRGELLISGLYESKSGIRTVCASGRVYAEVERRIEVFFPYEREEKLYTGKTTRSLALSLLGRTKTISALDECGEYDMTSSVENIMLFGKIRLPIKLIETCGREYRYEKKEYSKQQALHEATLEYEKQLHEALRDGELVGRELTLECTEDGCRIVCNISLIRDIARRVPMG